MHRAARNDARRLHFDSRKRHVLERTLAVDRIAQGIDDAAEQALAHRHFDDGAGALDDIAFLDAAVIAENDDADIVGFKVERHAFDAAGELDHLAGLDLIEAIDARDAVAHRQHLTHFGDVCFRSEIGNLLFENRGDFRGPDFH